MAAQRKVCVFSNWNLGSSGGTRVSRHAVFLCILGLFLAPILTRAARTGFTEKSGASSKHYLLHASLNENSLEEKMDDFAPEDSPGGGRAKQQLCD